LKLSVQKVAEIYKVLNNMKKKKPKFNMMTKRLSRKQIIILINSKNVERIIVKFNAHIFIIIMTNKVATFLDLNIRITNERLYFIFHFISRVRV